MFFEIKNSNRKFLKKKWIEIKDSDGKTITIRRKDILWVKYTPNETGGLTVIQFQRGVCGINLVGNHYEEIIRML